VDRHRQQDLRPHDLIGLRLERTGVGEQVWLVMKGVAQSIWTARILNRRQVLGRSRDCEVQIVHKTISRSHAEVWRRDGVCVIRDLESRNGTFIDGRRIVESSFSIGQAIQVGEVELNVVASNDADSDAVEDETELQAKSPHSAHGLLDKLSRGQVQVTNLLLRGLGEKEIAEKLCVSTHTVHSHVKQIYRLLGVRTRSQLLAKYLGGS
jgi:DNA-binding CsgD family transcriptional regulator